MKLIVGTFTAKPGSSIRPRKIRIVLAGLRGEHGGSSGGNAVARWPVFLYAYGKHEV